MPGSRSLVQVALNELNINQKQLADLLNVSTGQISRWKNHDDYISLELAEKLEDFCGLDEIPPEFALFVGSIAAAKKWAKAIELCAEMAADNNESGYVCYPLTDFYENAVLSNLASLLTDLGIKFPEQVPGPINKLFEDGELNDEMWEKFYKLEQIDLISSIFSVYADLIGFNSAYIDELGYHDNSELFELTMEIEANYLHLAACKLKAGSTVTPKFEAHAVEWTRWYKQKLLDLKKLAVEANLPLREELLGLVYNEVGEISLAAERQSLGLNDSMLHPDKYMNELLVGMRTINQVLPVIMQKIGIDPEEFQLDQSEFYAN